MKKLIDNVEDMSDDLQWGTISNLENIGFDGIKMVQFISYDCNGENFDFYLSELESIRKSYLKIKYIENNPNFAGWTFNKRLVNAIKLRATKHINIDKLIEKI